MFPLRFRRGYHGGNDETVSKVKYVGSLHESGVKGVRVTKRSDARQSGGVVSDTEAGTDSITDLAERKRCALEDDQLSTMRRATRKSGREHALENRDFMIRQHRSLV